MAALQNNNLQPKALLRTQIRIRIDLAVLDPDLFLERGSGSRGIENGPICQLNLISCSSKMLFYLCVYNFSHYQYQLNLKHILIEKKIKHFVFSDLSDKDPDQVRVDPHCFGSLDLNPGLKPH